MQQLLLDAFGPPEQNLALVTDELPAPSFGEVLVEIEAAPIDPMDLLILRGHYPLLPKTPAVPGAEGAGFVQTCGPGVNERLLGRRVLLPIRSGSWATHRVVQASDLLVLPDGIDPLFAATLRVNPPTAALLLRRPELADDSRWVISAPGSGAVGQAIIQLAKRSGVRTINVVRSRTAYDRIVPLGGDVTVLSDDLTPQIVKHVTGGELPRLAIDAVGGVLSGKLAQCLANHGTIVTYGAMSRKAPEVALADLIFRGISLQGFWLFDWAKQHGSAALDAVILSLAENPLSHEVAATYPLREWKRALSHASQPDRQGRVFLTPNSSQ